MSRPQRGLSRLAAISGVILVLAVVELMHLPQTWARLIVPRPLAVSGALAAAVTPSGDSALPEIGITVLRISLGLMLGSLAGVPVGLSAGLLGRLFGGLRIGIDFLRSIPQIALFPLFALLFGIGNLGKVMMATVSTFLIVFVSAADGTAFGVQERYETLEWMGASGWEKFVNLTLPQSLPSIAVGVRIAASVSVIVVLVAEMLYGTLDGIGYRLYLAQLSYHVDEMWAFIILIGLLGMALNALLSYLQRRLIPWDRVTERA
jgi:ABC-type nitrate/sulfonate/bicarbonate transport system permease component